MQKVIIVGNGMVGYKFCEKFVAQSGGKDFKMTMSLLPFCYLFI